jgi:RNA polymerase sigma-70 factor (ECF subfamily)
MSSQETTAVRVRAARAGDEAAIEWLYREFSPVVHGVLLSSMQRADADDLTQDVFETALQRLHQLREPAAFPGWLLRIARHAASDLMRRRGETALEAAEPVCRQQVEYVLDADRALQAIRGLPEAYRETLLLRLVEGLSGPQIAARTGLTEGSVRVNLHRGMGLLRAALLGDDQGGRR